MLHVHLGLDIDVVGIDADTEEALEEYYEEIEHKVEIDGLIQQQIYHLAECTLNEEMAR